MENRMTAVPRRGVDRRAARTSAISARQRHLGELLDSGQCEQPVVPPNQPRETVMPPAKKAAPAAKKSAAPPTAAPAKAAAQATVTLKHLAAALAESHDLAKKQAEALLGDLVALTAKHLKKGDKIRL